MALVLPPRARVPLLLPAMLALLVGVLAGLARLAVAVPDSAAAQAAWHGALMITAFLGTVIGLERAVALAAGGRAWPYLAPLCSGLGGLALLIGLPPQMAQSLFVAAGALLAAGSLLLLRAQRAAHLATLALGAVAWLAGSLPSAVPWWIAFLVLTIAGERLELTRFLPTPPAARRVFALIAAVLLAGLLLGFWQADRGSRLFAAALLALALWLLRHDIARRTVRQSGLTRYIAVCLLAGYAWLAAGALLGLAGGLMPGSPLRDAALHALLLGFVFSMIFGHAPIIFPAVVGVRIPYHGIFYLPLALLHLSLLARAMAGLAGAPDWTRAAALANAAALLLFVFTMIAGVVRGRRQTLHGGAAAPGSAT